MPDSITLLARPTAPGERRTTILTIDDDRVAVRAHLEAINGDPALILRVWETEPYHYTFVALDSWARLLGVQVGATLDEVMKNLVEDLKRKGHEFDARGDEHSLVAEHPRGTRRTAVLADDGSEIAVRAKQVINDEWELTHLRAYLPEVGWVHLGLDESGVAAMSTGRTDADGFDRFSGELARRGYELN